MDRGKKKKCQGQKQPEAEERVFTEYRSSWRRYGASSCNALITAPVRWDAWETANIRGSNAPILYSETNLDETKWLVFEIYSVSFRARNHFTAQQIETLTQEMKCGLTKHQEECQAVKLIWYSGHTIELQRNVMHWGPGSRGFYP